MVHYVEVLVSIPPIVIDVWTQKFMTEDRSMMTFPGKAPQKNQKGNEPDLEIHPYHARADKLWFDL